MKLALLCIRQFVFAMLLTALVVLAWLSTQE